MNLNQIRKAAEKLIEQGNLVLGALEIIEQQMAKEGDATSKGIKPRRSKPFTPKADPINVGAADGQFTLADYCARTGLEKIKARIELASKIAGGDMEIVSQGSGRRPTVYREFKA